MVYGKSTMKPKIIESDEAQITIDGEVYDVDNVTGLGWGDGGDRE